MTGSTIFLLRTAMGRPGLSAPRLRPTTKIERIQLLAGDFLINEYIYKNAIANKILLGKHSLNTSHMLTEFRVAKCKADVVILNGTSTVYEIKSEYDSFNRLENQINSYLKVFDHINVITSDSQITKLQTLLPENIGIMVLTNRNTIKTIRESEGNKKNINTEILFDSLRKNEYTRIVKEFYGEVPNVPNTQIYKEFKKLFCDLPVETVHDFGNVFYPSTNSYTFKFKNTGDEPLTIFNAKASCGCTVPNKPEKPILPGEFGEMDVVFKPKEGQQGTPVTKRITVVANTNPKETYLNIKSNVLKGM